MAANKQLTGKFKAASQSFIAISLLWLLMLFVLSFCEIGYTGAVHQLPGAPLKVILWALLGDIAFLLTLLFKAFVIYLIIYFLYATAAKTLYKVVITLSLIIHLALIKYFVTALVPLGADIYGYSWADIKQTVGASGGAGVGAILMFLVFVVFIVFAFKLLPVKLRINFNVAAVILTLSFLLLFADTTSLIKPVNLRSEFANNLAANKSGFFYAASLSHFYPPDDDADIYADSYIGDYEGVKSQPAAFDYTDPANYPFLHADRTGDVLSPFFKPAAQPPNVVIMLVEGLGRAFTNDGAYLGNFTPFIDSLAGKSLYWRNFLSEGGRTFAVLPSLLGSLPFTKNGFSEMGTQMPGHLSLPRLLKDNGYHTSFYYGGDSHFDNMDMFMRMNNVDEVNDQRSFPAGYVKMPAINGFTWGYSDKELFRHYFATRLPAQHGPQLSVILTVSTHDPFLLNEEGAYVHRFEQRMTQLSFDEAKKKQYRNYKNQYASILYLDDALRSFFNTYSKRADYANTIFLITGDHRMPELPMSDKIDRFHVPLIIYSPMLKRTAQMSSVSTHFDISPSLIAFLKHNYKIKSPQLVAWMGQGLDTAAGFRNIHSYPLMQTKTDLLDFIQGEYHLNGNTLFKLAADMSEEPVQDEAKLNQLKDAFDQFKRRNNRVINGARLIPDSIKTRY
ncbi:MAG: LTA synthase family protein [Mucilaginibacter sp.]